MAHSNTTVLRPLQDFLKTESAAGLLLLAMVPIALFWVNGPLSDSYDQLWSTKISLNFGNASLSLDLRHWINDGFMTIFFFVVGLEIKREFIEGDLRDPRKAFTPVVAALGGMLLPALIYLAFNTSGPGTSGWAIPMATDIAVVLGILALLGSRVPGPLKTFLLTLAIVDDIGAIMVIALFYSAHGIEVVPLAVSIVFIAVVYLLGRFDFRKPAIILALSIGAWVALHESGVHATLVGVALALVTPSSAVQNRELVDGESLNDISNPDAARETVSLARDSVSSVEWLQHLLHPWSSFLILPLFALANSGIEISADSLSNAATSPISLGIIVALLLGKPVGISLATVLAVRFGGSLPSGVTRSGIVAASVLAGVGFTVSMFITDLAFTDPEITSQAKAGVLAASFTAGILGFAALRFVLRRKPTRLAK